MNSTLKSESHSQPDNPGGDEAAAAAARFNRDKPNSNRRTTVGTSVFFAILTLLRYGCVTYEEQKSKRLAAEHAIPVLTTDPVEKLKLIAGLTLAGNWDEQTITWFSDSIPDTTSPEDRRTAINLAQDDLPKLKLWIAGAICTYLTDNQWAALLASQRNQQPPPNAEILAGAQQRWAEKTSDWNKTIETISRKWAEQELQHARAFNTAFGMDNPKTESGNK